MYPAKIYNCLNDFFVVYTHTEKLKALIPVSKILDTIITYFVKISNL